jgi:hypothetical protein
MAREWAPTFRWERSLRGNQTMLGAFHHHRRFPILARGLGLPAPGHARNPIVGIESIGGGTVFPKTGLSTAAVEGRRLSGAGISFTTSGVWLAKFGG